MNKQILAAALAFGAAGSAFGQSCDLIDDTFGGMGNQVPITSFPGWISASGTPFPNNSSGTPLTGNALRMRSLTASSATRTVPGSSSGVYSLSFEVATDDIISTFALACADGTVVAQLTLNDLINPMILGTATDQISGASTTFPQGGITFVEYDINEGVEYSIRINNTTLVANAPWPTPLCSTVATMTVSTAATTTPFSGDVYYDNICMGQLVGDNYCAANNNSTGVPSQISAVGVPNVSMNSLVLRMDNMPSFAWGYFLCSQTQGFVPNAAGSSGNLCLGGAIGRYVGAGQIQNSGGSGSISLAIDLTATPQPAGFVSIMAGETWNFQGWHRDLGPTSNFSNGLEVDFL